MFMAETIAEQINLLKRGTVEIFTEAELNDTSNRIADPSQMPGRFSPDYNSGADPSGDSEGDSGGGGGR